MNEQQFMKLFEHNSTAHIAATLDQIFKERTMPKVVYQHYCSLFRTNRDLVPYVSPIHGLMPFTLYGHLGGVEDAVYFLKNPHEEYDKGYCAVTDAYEQYQWERYKNG